MMQNQSYSNLVPANLPGYFLSRAQVAQRRDLDPRWFDTVGKMFILDEETCFIVPAGEMKYCDNRTKMVGHQMTRLVVSQDGGIFLGFTGRVPNPWIRTLSKIGFPIDKDTRNDQHFVKAFGLVDEGPIMGYHVLRTGNGVKQQEIDSVNGYPVSDIDFVAVKGQVYLVATTLPTLTIPKRQCFTVKASYEDLLQKKPFQLDWNKTPWTEGYNVTGLRGTIKNEEVIYTFLDQDKGNLYNVRYNDKTAKVIEEGVKGILITVTGAKVSQDHETTVVTDDQVIALGTGTKPFRQIIADFNKNPTLFDLGRNLRSARMINGILGDKEIYFRNPETSLAHTMVVDREYQPTC